MQHYGLPTRILDLTENALVGLYFACKEEYIQKEKGIKEKADGEVIVFDIDDKNICYYNSDRVSILANVTKCKTDFSFNYNYFSYLLNVIDEIDFGIEKYKYNRELEEIEYDYLNFLNKKNFFLTKHKIIDHLSFRLINILPTKCIQEVKNYFKTKELPHNSVEVLAYHSYIRIKEEVLRLIEAEKKNISNVFFKKLVTYIREDKPYFQPEIDPRDLSKILLVKPKLNNPRIIRQQGSFFLFGIKNDNKKMVEFDRNWVHSRIVIDKNHKVDIRKELKNLGIFSASLFPEIEMVTNHIKDKFNIKNE